MDDRTAAAERLAALGAGVRAHRLRAELTERGLVVSGSDAEGVTCTVTCRPRLEDGGALWFWTGVGQPVAPADRVVDAVVVLKGRLAVGVSWARS